MKIDKDTLYPFLVYNQPINYDDNIILYPISMKDFFSFQIMSKAITVRKNSIFRDKKIIKMSYLDFLIYSFKNSELEEQYEIAGLSQYLVLAIQLIQLCCKDAEIRINIEKGIQIYINDVLLTHNVFDDLRRIIIIQNDIDFDIDEFINYDTQKQLEKSQQYLNRKSEKVGIEDYIDSLVIAMNTTEDVVMNMSIRKFWRYLKRYQLFESYKILKTGECSGMVTFKEPIKYWMSSLDIEDKYGHLKANEDEIRGKMG